MKNQTTPPPAAPFFELRIGGLQMTIQQVPYRLLTLAASILGPLAGATWLAR